MKKLLATLALASFACTGDQPTAVTSQPGSEIASLVDTLPMTVGNPGTVTDLAVAGMSDSAATLAFTEVDDGTGHPASYNVRFSQGTLAWGSATDVTLGSCSVPMAGGTIGAKRTCAVRGLSPSSKYQFELVAFRGTLNVDAVFGGLSNVVSTATTVASGTGGRPGAVTTLAVAAVSDSSATLSFIEVDDGTGHPATYNVRYAPEAISWGSAADVSSGSCKVPMAGTAIGARRTCRVLGLAGSTRYQFQLVAFRGTLNQDAVFGDLSNAAAGVTAARIASVTVSPKTASVAAGATQQFTAILTDSAGRTLSGRTITWTSSNSAVATVKNTGLATGVAAGSATITATSEGVSGAATATVTSATTNPGTVTDLAVNTMTDSSVTLTFTEVTDGAGGAASYDVRYAVAPLSWGSASSVTNGTCRVPLTGATVGAKRSCTVPGLSAATSYQFQLVSFRGTLNVDAVFGGLSNVVSATTSNASIPPPSPPPPPPPPPSTGTWSHEPSGLATIRDDGWENGALGDWALYYWSADKPITVQNITDSPLGESQAFEIGYLAGHVGGGGTEARWDIPSTQRGYEIFVGFYVQVNPQWQGHSSGINKMIFLADGGASGFSAMWYEMFGSGSAPLGLYVVNQSGGSPGGMHENVTAANFTRGDWHKVEIYQRQGSPGVVRVWVDDVLAIDRADVITRNAPIDAVAISGIWGGVGDSKAQNDYMRFDRIHVSMR